MKPKKLLSLLLSLALVVGMIPAFTMTAAASGTKTITGFWDSNGTGHIESVHIVSSSDDVTLTENDGNTFSVNPGEIVTVTVKTKSGFSVSNLSLDVGGGEYINIGEMTYQGNGIWYKFFKMPDLESSDVCMLYLPTKDETVSLDMPVCYWDGDTIKWRAVSGSEKYEMSMDQFLEGDSSILFYADIDVSADGSVKDSSQALVVNGMVYKPIKDLVTYNTSTGFYSFNYRSLVSIYSNGRYNYRMTALREPNISSELFATEKTVTGAQLKNGYTQMPSTVNFTNFTLPTNGQTYTSSIQTASDFPGKVTRYVFQMFHKSMNGTTASAGDNVGFVVYVDLDEGYGWGDNMTGYLNGQPQDNIVHNDSMGTEYGFLWTFKIGYTDKIQITDQSPGTVEYVNGEDVKLFVNATGADSYQWQKYTVRSGGGKQQIRPDDIEGATGSTYTISKADSSAAGTYRCALSCSDGTIYTKDIVLKMVDEKTTNPFVDVSESDYFYEPVLWAVGKGITNGTDATHFSPAATCTRGQVVTFLWRAAGSPKPTSTTNPFTDVAPSDYYYNAVLWAVGKNITNGTSATTFGPNDGCTRGQVVTFLHRFENSPKPSSTTNPFVDVSSSEYYYTPVLWAVEKEITNGTDKTHFSPNMTCTRGQIVTFLYRDMK